MAKVTIYDVAKQANCSIATVSLVLQNSGKIKPATQKRVMDAVNELGYLPNFAARSLSNNKTDLLGLIVPNVDNPLFASMLRGVEECANSKGYGLILGISSLMLDKEISYIRMLKERRVDGLLVFPTFVDEIFDTFLREDHDHKDIPLVLCGSSGVREYPVSYVKCDNRVGAYMAVEHLIKIGRRRIACLCAVANRQQAQSRILGYQDALLFNGLPYDESYIYYCTQDNADIYATTQRLLKEKPVDALFCLYDHMSIVAMNAVLSAGYRIPEDIAMIGYDNIPISQYLAIPLSTIETHGRRIGSMATELLIDKIRQPDIPCRQIQLKPDLVVRASTVGRRAAPAAETPPAGPAE